MVELLAFLDLVDQLGEFMPDGDPEVIELFESIQKHAIQLCRQNIADRNESEPDDDPHEDQDTDIDYF
ncbi:MAG: hypothetical protein AAGI37_15525 [Planctomycetota bacterium]